MKFITLGVGRYIAISDIAAFYNTDCIVPKRDNPYLLQQKEEGKVLDISAGKKAKPRAIVVTKRGEVILTQFKAETIMQKIEAALSGTDDVLDFDKD